MLGLALGAALGYMKRVLEEVRDWQLAIDLEFMPDMESLTKLVSAAADVGIDSETALWIVNEWERLETRG